MNPSPTTYGMKINESILSPDRSVNERQGGLNHIPPGGTVYVRVYTCPHVHSYSMHFTVTSLLKSEATNFKVGYKLALVAINK